MRRQESLDNAWRVHEAQLDWTAKADAKAAFAFSIGSVLIATVAVLFSTGVMFDRLDNCLSIVTFTLGSMCLVAGVVFAAVGVAPRLRNKQLEVSAKSNFIYFGHARHWDPEDLQESLRKQDLLPQLARQIQVAADVAWRKHVAVAWSIWLTLGGGLLLALYAVAYNLPS